MLHAGRLARKKIVKQHRLVFRPNAARTAKIRNAGFRADACTREKDDRSGSTQPRGEFFKLHYWSDFILFAAEPRASPAGRAVPAELACPPLEASSVVLEYRRL